MTGAQIRSMKGRGKRVKRLRHKEWPYFHQWPPKLYWNGISSEEELLCSDGGTQYNSWPDPHRNLNQREKTHLKCCQRALCCFAAPCEVTNLTQPTVIRVPFPHDTIELNVPVGIKGGAWHELLTQSIGAAVVRWRHGCYKCFVAVVTGY